jgi:tetratricopeptide (TPR) repeat protein
MALVKNSWLCIITIICFTSLNFARVQSPADEGAIEKLAKQLKAAKTMEQCTVLLESNKGLITAELEEIILEEGNDLFNYGEYPQALSIFHLAQAIGEQIGDKAGIGTALNGIGNIYLFQGKYNQALDHYQKSLMLRRELNDKVGIARTLNGIGNIHCSQGNYDQALNFFKESIALSEELNNKAGIARALNGGIEWGRKYSLCPR